MTWRELKEKLNKLSEEQLEMEVKVWAEEKPLSDASLEFADDDFWFDNNYGDDGCFQRSDFSADEFEEMAKTARIVVNKGTPYIWSDL